MKIVLAAVSILAAIYAALVLPVLNQGKVVAKAGKPGSARREREARARVARVLDAFRHGDLGAETLALATLRGLPAYDERRFAFAEILAKRGRAREAYEAARPKVRFAELSLPNDGEMEAYARLAERAGHPGEAAWARERTGEAGHFRVWMRGERYIFARKRGSDFVGGQWNYRIIVKRHMDMGLQLYPAHREEIEAFRRELLAAP